MILLLDNAVERLEVGGFLAANSSSPLFLLPFRGSLSLTAMSTDWYWPPLATPSLIKLERVGLSTNRSGDGRNML